MRQVSHHHDLTVLSLHKSILDAAGIGSFIFNGNSWWLANGGVAMLIMFLGKPEQVQNRLFEPVLCIVDDDNFEEALAVLMAHQDTPFEGADWVCTACGEVVPGNFDACWQCNAVPPAS